MDRGWQYYIVYDSFANHGPVILYQLKQNGVYLFILKMFKNYRDDGLKTSPSFDNEKLFCVKTRAL